MPFIKTGVFKPTGEVKRKENERMRLSIQSLEPPDPKAALAWTV